jgi:hypothetical protein
VGEREGLSSYVGIVTQFALRWTEKHMCREQSTILKFIHSPVIVMYALLWYYVRYRTLGTVTRLGADD